MSTPAAVVALGARTPVGLRAESFAAAVRAGISRVREHPTMIDAAGNPLSCAIDARIEPSVFGPRRLAELAIGALGEVMAKLFERAAPAGALPLLLALPDRRPGFGAQDTSAVVRGVEAAALPANAAVHVTAVGGGRAAFVRALEQAVGILSTRRSDVCLVGGVDSYVHPETIDWLEAETRLAREGVRGGFIPGEAAGMIALANPVACTSFGYRPLAVVRGIGLATEPRSLASEEGLLGEGLTEAIRRAVHMAGAGPADDIYCDINGERQQTDEWGFAVLRMPHAFRDAARYVSPVRSCGDVGAASGALGCVLAIQAWERQYATGPRALVWASSPEGLRGAVVLDRERPWA